MLPTMPRILLPLLLCLALIAGAVGSAWSMTAMALPMQAMAMQHDKDGGDSAHDCCHDAASLHCDSESAGHGQPSPCADGGHCDCTQHCNMLLSVAGIRLGTLPPTPAPAATVASHDDVSPGQLNRPPIA